jgi:hypothetical protein
MESEAAEEQHRLEGEEEYGGREEERDEQCMRREEAKEEYHHEREEDHIRIENELHEQHLRDSHQQERTDQMIQIALSGLFTYMGMKL